MMNLTASPTSSLTVPASSPSGSIPKCQKSSNSDSATMNICTTTLRDTLRGDLSYSPIAPKPSIQQGSKQTALPSDTSTAESTTKIPAKTRMALICAQILTFCHQSAMSGPYLIIPYYVASTPSNGWTVSDLAIIFTANNIGYILSSQIIMVAECSKSKKNTVLFLGHLSQFVLGVTGFVIMSSVFGFSLPLFYVAAFGVGFSSNYNTTQSYAVMISDDEEIQTRLLGDIGRVSLIQTFLNAFITPPIYEQLGFAVFCVVLGLLQCIGIIALCALWKNVENKVLDSGSPNATIPKLTKPVPPKHFSLSKSISELLDPDGNDGMEKSVSLAVALTTMRSLSIQQMDENETETENHSESISEWKRLSPSMYTLLFVSTVDAICFEMYNIVYPVVFEVDFGISASVSGYLNAVSNVFSYLLISIILKYASKCTPFRYPSSLLIVITLMVLCEMGYIVFYVKYIAFAVHWIMCRMHIVVCVIEMISRVYLSSQSAFNRIASIGGILKSIGYLIGAAVGPILYGISGKLTFLVMATANVVILVVVILVFIYRRRYLLGEFDDDVKKQYLTLEKEHYLRN